MDEITNFITPLYAGLIGLLYIALASNVSRLRVGLKIAIGDGGNHQLSRAIRAHANLTENAPIALILLTGIELQEFSIIVLHVLGTMLVTGRLLHAYGLSRNAGPSFGRSGGILLTWLMIVASSLLAIVSVVSSVRF
jgi:uncharacterized membrane protein YecN with MAPEG domain